MELTTELRHMKKVTILAVRNTIASSVMGPMDVFFLAGQLWNYIHGLPLNPYFDVEIVSENGSPVTCLNNVILQPHRSMDAVDRTDLLIIPTIPNPEYTVRNSADVINWIRYHHRQGTNIAAICTGVFLLAETGLLDRKTATTHWGFVDIFRQMYPQVHLLPERLITDERTIFCAGAMAAGIDLSLYLVEKYCGHKVAIECSKALIHDMGRHSQAPYSVFQFQKNHADEVIKLSQKWLEENYTQKIDLNEVAKTHGMSRRTFERRFKKATGDTPLCYLQRTRVEAAKRLMENTNNAFDKICYELGYENSGHFREIFKKHTGLLPSEYQDHFRSRFS